MVPSRLTAETVWFTSFLLLWETSNRYDEGKQVQSTKAQPHDTWPFHWLLRRPSDLTSFKINAWRECPNLVILLILHSCTELRLEEFKTDCHRMTCHSFHYPIRHALIKTCNCFYTWETWIVLRVPHARRAMQCMSLYCTLGKILATKSDGYHMHLSQCLWWELDLLGALVQILATHTSPEWRSNLPALPCLLIHGFQQRVWPSLSCACHVSQKKSHPLRLPQARLQYSPVLSPEHSVLIGSKSQHLMQCSDQVLVHEMLNI